MFARCVNDLCFGYCKTEPDGGVWLVMHAGGNEIQSIKGTCSKKPDKCKQYSNEAVDNGKKLEDYRVKS